MAQGVASWFCCGPHSWGPCGHAGGGACGTCDNPKFQAAWQKLNGFPTSYCGQQVAASCGSLISVTSLCYATGVVPSIADHGPGACTGQSTCKPLSHRIVDLTPAAFAQLAPLGVGLLTVVVYF
jgi:hypothetical protein